MLMHISIETLRLARHTKINIISQCGVLSDFCGRDVSVPAGLTLISGKAVCYLVLVMVVHSLGTYYGC